MRNYYYKNTVDFIKWAKTFSQVFPLYCQLQDIWAKGGNCLLAPCEVKACINLIKRRFPVEK